MTRTWSRAAFLRASGATLASAALPKAAHAVVPVTPEAVDVVVVGGGLAGLATARRLRDRGVDKVVVLEARERVGGRTVNLSLEGDHVVEGGGEWVGPTQTRVTEVAAELGVHTFPAYYDGRVSYDLLGKVSEGLLPASSWRERADAVRMLYKLDRLAKSLPRGASWEAPDAASLDAITLGDWLRKHEATPFTHSVFKLITRAVLAGYPDRISLLWVLHYVGASGSLLQILLNDGGGQDLRFEGGSQLVSIRMAEDLGAVVRLGQPVRTITDTGEGVRVVTSSAIFDAKRVVVAMMPADMMRIRFEPGLPPLRRDLMAGWARLTRLPLIKGSVVYPTPFWREEGHSGAMQSDQGPIQLIFDNSPPDGSLGVLTAFLSVAESPAMADRRTRRQAIEAEFVRYFGPQAAKSSGYVEKDWAVDPWSTGCLTPMTPGLLSRTGAALREPVGRIHWAGTETARIWCGYMDGAVRSGDRAGDEVAAVL